MVDSTTVLWGQTLAYTFYVLVLMAVMAWFALRVTRPGGQEGIKPAVFYGFVAFLTVCGVSLHFITYSTIPWAPVDLNRSGIRPDREFTITAEQHTFTLPAETLAVNCRETVRFNVVSKDLTYGFGLFREDNSMVFQMQVLPGHATTSCGNSIGPASTRSARPSTRGPPGSGWVCRLRSWWPAVMRRSVDLTSHNKRDAYHELLPDTRSRRGRVVQACHVDADAEDDAPLRRHRAGVLRVRRVRRDADAGLRGGAVPP